MEQTYLTASKTKDYDPPCLANFIMMRRRVQKSALKLLKIAYLKVKPPYLIKKCTSSSQSKFLWVKKCHEVGGLARKFQSYPLGEASRKIMLNFNLQKDSL